MSKSRFVSAPRMTEDIAALGLLDDEPFFLLDVGASGGIEPGWRHFGKGLQAVGFDPLVRECERLNRSEPLPGVRYQDGFVGVDRAEHAYAKPENVRREAPWNADVYGRSSAIAARSILRASSKVRYNSNDPDVRLSDRHFSLDTFLDAEAIPSVDFIKVDTDGYDFEVLTGARDSLSRRRVLGLYVECQFHGALHRHANLFANIDGLLRDAGYSLYDLEFYRYTRASLPGRFGASLPAQTSSGQLLWADALYLRDYADPGYADEWGPWSRAKALKLACLYELHGLFDCAAEMLLAERERLFAGLPVTAWLDFLAEEIEPGCGGYAAHLERFRAAPRSFYPRPGDRLGAKALAPPGRLRRVLSRLLAGPRRSS